MARPAALLVALLGSSLVSAVVSQGLANSVVGTVRDEAGSPVPEATVQLEPIAPWLEPELAVRLPGTRSDAEGRYSLLIAPDLIATRSRAMGLVLRVERAGFQSWHEQVPEPLGLYEGSDVTLRRTRKEDNAVVRVENPLPGMVLVVERCGAHRESYLYWTHGPVEQARGVVPVPASGEVSLNSPLLPSPLAVAPGLYGLMPLGWQVRLFYPGRSTPRTAIAAGSTVTLRASPRPPAARVVRRSDGRPVSHLRVLVDIEDGRSRWFALPGSQVPDDPLSPPQLVTADGCGLRIWDRKSDGELVLEPQELTREFRIVDEQGQPLHRVHATWRSAEHGPFVLARDAIHGEHWVVEGGTLRLDERQMLDPGVLMLRSGGLSLVCPYPQYFARGDVLTLRQGRTVTVQTEDTDGNAIPNTHVTLFAEDESGTRRTWPAANGLPFLTDSAGNAVCEGVEHDTVGVTAFGMVFPETPLLGKNSVRVVGRHLRPVRVLSVDGERRPVPFVNVGWPPVDGYRPWTWVRTDSRGAATALLGREVTGLAPMQPGRTGTASIQLRDGEQSCSVVEPGPLAIVRIPPPDRVASFCTGKVQAPEAEVLFTAFPVGTEAILFRWTPQTDFWLQSVRDKPPVLVLRDELLTTDGVLQADRRAVKRRVPLNLTGDVPTSLRQLRAAPRSCLGKVLQHFPGNYLTLDAEGRAILEARDDHEHGVWIMHPDLVPAPATLPSADMTAPVTVQVARGARLTIRFAPVPHYDASDALFLTVVDAHGQLIGHAEIDVPNRANLERHAVIDVPAPFALPKGELRARISGACMGGTDYPLPVRGTEPVVLTPGG